MVTVLSFWLRLARSSLPQNDNPCEFQGIGKSSFQALSLKGKMLTLYEELLDVRLF